jgi:arabinan endo-1,5-alpha-L-arabinosidase
MRTARCCLLLLLSGACDANVVDAVLEPLPMKDPDPVPDAGASGALGVAGSGSVVAGAGGEAGAPPEPNPLGESLLHRYSFDGESEQLVDSKGAAHGTAVGVLPDGSGQVTLAGDYTGQYVALPKGIISGLNAATIEAWLTWQGGHDWQRIFDFGNQVLAPDEQFNGTSYLFLTAMSTEDPTRNLARVLHAAYSPNGVENEDVCQASAPLPIGEPTHVALVIDPTRASMTLYQNGQPLETTGCAFTGSLSLIDDTNCWLGHSNFSRDRDLKGSFDEFRIYDVALTAEQIAASFSAGPDAKL